MFNGGHCDLSLPVRNLGDDREQWQPSITLASNWREWYCTVSCTGTSTYEGRTTMDRIEGMNESNKSNESINPFFIHLFASCRRTSTIVPALRASRNFPNMFCRTTTQKDVKDEMN
jgi:hypothetical protein